MPGGGGLDREWPLWIQVVRQVLTFLFRIAFRYRVHGMDRVPRHGPLLLVSNHASHLDPPLVGCATPRRVAYLARSSLFRPRVFAAMITAIGAVPIEREKSGLGGMRATLDILRADGAIIVFPEGTRTPDGRTGKLRGGFLTVARRSAAQVVPVWVEGSFDAFPRGARFPRPRPIRIRFGVPFRVPEGSDDAAAIAYVEEQWRALAERRPVPAPGGQLPSGVKNED